MAFTREGRPILGRIARSAAACVLTFACWSYATPLVAAADEPPAATATDAGYRAFEKVETFLRARNAKQFAIPAPGIDEARYVTIGGIEQWITIRGWNRDNPVLLFVHGGPGDVTNTWAFAMFAPWEKYFTVVQWDERGAGRTLHKSGPGIAPTITVARMVQDGIELSEYLRAHLGKRKIVVLAHSFGTILALRMVGARPDLFYAYVGTGQVADTVKSYAADYFALLKKARDTDNQQAIDDLTRVGPPPYPSGEGFQVQRRWGNQFEGADQFLPGTIGLALSAPGGSVQDVDDWFDGQILSADQLVPQTHAITPADLGSTFALPMFVFQGAEDFTTSPALARDYLDSITAPHKQFVAIEGAGHFAMFMHSDRFLKLLIDLVRPLALTP
jgi:pimeloyl-ACP methyl ester carboxylesterase